MRYTLLCSLLALALASCKKEATVWENDWNAPLINDTLSLNNLVNDSTLEVSSGFYAVDLTRNLINVSASELIEIPDTTIIRNFSQDFNLPLPPGTVFDALSESFVLELGEVQMKKLTLREGFIDVSIENPIETILYFFVEMPYVKKDGIKFQKLLAVPAGANGVSGILDQTLDLSGYTMDLSGSSGSAYNELVIEYSVTTDPAGDTTLVTNQDIVEMEIAFRDNTIFYAQGYFGNIMLSDTTSVNLDALNIYESGMFDISNLSIGFDVENGIKVGAVARLNMIRNENALGNVVNLSSPEVGNNITVNPATGSWSSLMPSLTGLLFNSSNSNIEGYVENLGVKHEVGYSFEMNPWGNVSGGWDQIFPESRVRVDLSAQMPLSIGLNDLVLKDTFDLVLNQDPNKTHIVSGDLILKAKNGFPFNADVTLYMVDANGNTLHSIPGSDIIESSQYGALDVNTGVLVQSSEVLFSLTEAMIADVNEVTSIVVRAQLNSPDPNTGLSQQILIPENAFFEVKLRSEFKTENRF